MQNIKENNKKAELKALLERLNAGEDVDKFKEEAEELLKEISPKDLSEAEQELIQDGLAEEDLRHLCQAHIAAMAEELKKLQMKLPDGHPLDTLIKEHQEILNLLEDLEEVNKEIQGLTNYDKTNPGFDRLKDIAEGLIETEKHHEREEETIFPEVAGDGITAPVNIMLDEHEDMWPRKEKIEELANNVAEMDFAEFKAELDENAKYLVLHLRDHIFKEDNILYPTAESIIAEDKWEDIKTRCDEIGYCSFTPEV